MKKLWNKITSWLTGNKLWVTIGAGGAFATIWATANKGFYYGILAVIVLVKLLGSKILGRKLTQYLVLGLVAIFAYSFTSEVILKKGAISGQLNNFFTNLWNKIQFWQ